MAEATWKMFFLKYLVITIVKTVNAVGWLFDQMGIKLYRVNEDRVYKTLPAAYLQELQSDPVIREPIDLVLQGLANDNQLPLTRRFVMVKLIEDTLKKRVQQKKALLEKPDILNIEIKKPIYLIGLPRTGTTFMLWLLNQDNNLRAPLLWELNFPCPPGPVKNFREDPRYKMCEFVMRIENWQRDPGTMAAHPSEADRPEECIVIFWRTFWQYLHVVAVDSLTGLESWYYSRTPDDMRQIYDYYKKTMQLLAYGHESKIFLMKAHVHLLCLESLMETYPDACLVYTHRALSEIVPSFISLLGKAMSHYGKPDKQKFIKRMLRLLKEFTSRSVRVMKKYDALPGRNPIFILMYKDLIKDPMGSMQKIYEYYGIEWTLQAENGMKEYIANDPKKKKVPTATLR